MDVTATQYNPLFAEGRILVSLMSLLQWQKSHLPRQLRRSTTAEKFRLAHSLARTLGFLRSTGSYRASTRIIMLVLPAINNYTDLFPLWASEAWYLWASLALTTIPTITQIYQYRMNLFKILV